MRKVAINPSASARTIFLLIKDTRMMNTGRLHTNPLSTTNPIRDFIPPAAICAVDYAVEVQFSANE